MSTLIISEFNFTKCKPKYILNYLNTSKLKTCSHKFDINNYISICKLSKCNNINANSNFATYIISSVSSHITITLTKKFSIFIYYNYLINIYNSYIYDIHTSIYPDNCNEILNAIFIHIMLLTILKVKCKTIHIHSQYQAH